ncbi:T9SS type A sorting domain-containing protein [Taibaiella soli]|uniref:Secretion system C-terminal sorting domain-containing protein n=1 Tax=Taibaiella soli TaxID=1649169 RepID=A0A2W2BCD4_9BACT|nr:T9SS type A sorting domain-containing protein [Taibaiella soli]PZF71326.1 hypothetical protein DN068_18700 [Taibaiella soli]
MKKLFLYLLCLGGSVVAHASHITGATLSYEYTGTGNIYRLHLRLAHECSPNSSTPYPTEYINLRSTSLGITNQVKALNVTSVDTLDKKYIFCPSVSSSCLSTSYTYGGISVYNYVDTVVLPSAPDWYMGWTEGTRNAGIVNLANAGSQNIYLEAFLNNSTAINSNPYTPSPLPVYLATNVLNTMPYPAADADGDSLHYDFITPMDAQGSLLSYASSYSLAQPFGSGSMTQVDQIAQTLKLKSNLVGRFDVAMRINEYRNGQLVGYSSSDWCTLITPNTVATTVPMPLPGTNFSVNTCPGQPNSVSITFHDSTATDSVFVDVTPPTMPGWTFTSSTASAMGTATTTITWTTPSSASPAALPSFFIDLRAHDLACSYMGAASYPLMVHLTQCTADSVWAGDANADYTVNMYDPLAIAVAYGQTGSIRPWASNSWIAQYAPNWTNFFAFGPNMKHADCNGDGTVNSADLTVVTTNYGQVHLRPGASQQRTTGVPDLYFDLTGISLMPGQTVSVPVKLGSSAINATNVYGLAASVKISGITLSAAPVITYNTSWLGTSSNTLSFTKAINNNQTDWAYARTDHQNITGEGTIAYLNFTVPANATVGQAVVFEFDNSKLIDNAGNAILAYNALSDTAHVSPLSVNTVHGAVQAATVVPNPVKNEATLQLSVARQQDLNIKIINTLGQTMWQQNATVSGTQNIAMPTGNLAAGLYMIVIKDEMSASPSVIRFVKE